MTLFYWWVVWLFGALREEEQLDRVGLTSAERDLSFPMGHSE